MGFTNELVRRIDEHNTPFSENRMRLGAKATVYGAPWILWGYVSGFGGQTMTDRNDAAYAFEGFFRGHAMDGIRSINIAEAMIKRKIRNLQSENPVDPRWTNLRWCKNH